MVEKEKKRVENERAGERNREGGFGIKWKVEKKKRRGWDIWEYMCGAEKTREKK